MTLTPVVRDYSYGESGWYYPVALEDERGRYVEGSLSDPDAAERFAHAVLAAVASSRALSASKAACVEARVRTELHKLNKAAAL